MRLPPNSIEHEQSVIASCILIPNHREIALDTLKPEAFYSKQHQVLYSCITNLSSSGKPVDIVTLIESLKANDQLEMVGGGANLAKLMDCPVATDIEQYIKVLKEKHAVRQTIETCLQIQAECYECNGNALDVLESAKSRIGGITCDTGDDNLVTLDSVIVDTVDEIEACQSKNGITGIQTGFKYLDLMTSGLQRGDLIVIAARPSMGKTAFTTQIALNTAQCGNPVAFYSLEMARGQLGKRILSVKSGVNGLRVRSGDLSQHDWQNITSAAGRIHNLPVFIDDTPGMSYLSLRQKIRKAHKTNGIKLVVLDYLGFITGDETKSKVQEVGGVVRGIKSTARELNIPIILVCQLNRKCEERTNKRPMLSDLRETGDIEQDTDVALFIYRDEVYNKSENNPNIGKAEILVRKQRNGPTGEFILHYNSKTTEFSDMVIP